VRQRASLPGAKVPYPWSSTPQARSRCIRNSPAVTPFRRFRPLYPSELPGHAWRGRESNLHLSHRALRVPAWVRTRDLRRVGTVLYPLSHRNGSGDGIRTRDIRLMRPARTTELLYPAVRRAGFEPATCRLRGGSSTAELTARGGGGRGRTATGNRPNRFRDGGRRQLSAGSSTMRHGRVSQIRTDVLSLPKRAR
jgi:hypothetical protein